MIDVEKSSSDRWHRFRLCLGISIVLLYCSEHVKGIAKVDRITAAFNDKIIMFVCLLNMPFRSGRNLSLGSSTSVPGRRST